MKSIIENYIPVNRQEEKDKQLMLQIIEREGIPLGREPEAHFTVSAIVLNHERNQFLFVYHNIYDSWSWMGGHMDGDPDPKRVILKEVREESGLSDVSFLTDDIISLEVLTVEGHVKRGEYVYGHLHLNVTYLLEADSNAPLRIKPDENKGVRWFPLDQFTSVSNEKWFNEHIYNKLYRRILSIMNNDLKVIFLLQKIIFRHINFVEYEHEL